MNATDFPRRDARVLSSAVFSLIARRLNKIRQRVGNRKMFGAHLGLFVNIDFAAERGQCDARLARSGQC